MKVALDFQQTIGTATGMGEYSRGLAEALEAAGVDVVRLREPRLDPWRFDRRVAWDQLLLPLYARRSGADLLHCAAGTLPFALTIPCVVTVHDVAWLRVQQHTRAYARAYFGRLALSAYRRASRIVVDSAFSRDELFAVADLDPARVAVAYPGVAREFCLIDRRPRDRDPFVLAVGTVERRKNLAVVLRAIAGIPDLRLVSVGPPTPYLQECRRLASDLGIANRVEFRGYVQREALLDLYASAAAAVAASTYEGFGYAAAQALCSGTPLLASGAASHPEVVRGDAPLLDPQDAGAWRDALGCIAGDRAGASARAAAVRPGAIARLGWNATARTLIEVYRDALASGLRAQ